MTAKQVRIGDRPCRIYGTDCAEYLLLQMTDEHELQRMDNEVAAIAQGAAHSFLFAAVPVKSWNDELSPWEAPAVRGKESFGGNAADTLRFLTEQVIPAPETAVCTAGKRPDHSERLLAGRAVRIVGLHADSSVFQRCGRFAFRMVSGMDGV